MKKIITLIIAIILVMTMANGCTKNERANSETIKQSPYGMWYYDRARQEYVYMDEGNEENWYYAKELFDDPEDGWHFYFNLDEYGYIGWAYYEGDPVPDHEMFRDTWIQHRWG